MITTAILKIINFYQKYLSLDQGVVRTIFIGKDSDFSVCRHSPTCSDYTYQAIEKYGLGKGSFLGIKRIIRCNPFNKGGFDPLQ